MRNILKNLSSSYKVEFYLISPKMKKTSRKLRVILVLDTKIHHHNEL